MKAQVLNCLKFFQLFSLIAIALSVPLTASAAVCSSTGQSSSYEWIDAVQVGNFSHVSGNNTGYADFTATQTIPLSPGPQNISLTPGFNSGSYNEYWSVWIDFNQNQIFEATEQVFTGASSLAVSGSINVPATALPGLTTMRVSMKYGSAPAACESFTWGEVEDYTVDISGEPSPEPVPVPVPTLYTVNVDNNYFLSRTGVLGDSAVWVIEKDGAIVLQRNAANELTYVYFNNTVGSQFRVWVSEAGQQASNIVEYEGGLPVSSHELTVDSNYMVSRSGFIGESLTWVIEKDGEIVLERNAANELDYLYFNNLNDSYYRIWLKQFVNGAYEIVSNVVSYVPGTVVLPPPNPVVPTLYTLNVDNNYILSRTGDLGDAAVWVIEKDGVIVLQRNAANELTYQYFSNTIGSKFKVWLTEAGQQASNIVEYEAGLPVSSHEISIDSNYMVSRTGFIGESLTWVIEKDGLIVLERNAANELDYTYFNNVNDSYYRIWLKQFINGAYENVSNVVYYVPGAIILPPPDPVAPTLFTLNVDNNYVLSRTGELGDNITWEIEKDGVIVLSRNASSEMTYQYFSNTVGSNFKVWLAAGGQPVSNAVEYVGGSLVSSHDINVDSNYNVSRSGVLGESLTWVIEKDGVIVLERNAANELDYTYFNNTNGSYFRVWLKQFINGKYEIVSNVIYYVPGVAILPYSIITNSAYDLIRDGAIGEQVSWVIEENGVVIFEQDASTGLIYNYPGLLAQNNYRAWLVQIVNGVPEVASNVLEFTPGVNFDTYSLSVDPTNRIYRSGSLGDSLTWVIEKNGSVVLERNAENELDYLYFSNTSGSSFRVWLEQFSGAGYYRVSNVVEYSIP